MLRKWLIFISSRILVIGILKLGIVVVSIISVECGILVIFFEVSIRVSIMIVILLKFSGMLQVWVINIVVKEQQIIELMRLNEQLIGRMNEMILCEQLNFISCLRVFGQVVFELLVVKVISIGFFSMFSRWKIFFFSIIQLMVISIVLVNSIVRQQLLMNEVQLSRIFSFWEVIIDEMVVKMVSGVMYIIQFVIFSIMCDIMLRVVISGVLNFFFSDVLVMLKNIENIMICRILLLVIVLVMLVGMVCDRNFFRFMLLIVRLVFIVFFGIVRFNLVFGCWKVMIISLMRMDNIEEVMNQIIVLLFIWLMVVVLLRCIMLIVRVLNINGVMIILINCRNRLVSSVMLFVQVEMVVGVVQVWIVVLERIFISIKMMMKSVSLFVFVIVMIFDYLIC